MNNYAVRGAMSDIHWVRKPHTHLVQLNSSLGSLKLISALLDKTGCLSHTIFAERKPRQSLKENIFFGVGAEIYLWQTILCYNINWMFGCLPESSILMGFHEQPHYFIILKTWWPFSVQCLSSLHNKPQCRVIYFKWHQVNKWINKWVSIWDLLPTLTYDMAWKAPLFIILTFCLASVLRSVCNPAGTGCCKNSYAFMWQSVRIKDNVQGLGMECVLVCVPGE